MVPVAISTAGTACNSEPKRYAENAARRDEPSDRK